MIEIFQSREVFSVKEVAKYLKRSEATIRDWVFYNKIPFYKVNGNICFYGQDLNEWFESMFMAPGFYEEYGIHRSKIKKPEKRILQNFNNFIENLKKNY